MNETELLERARENVARNEDGSITLLRLVDEVARLLNWNPEAERRKRAAAIVERGSKSGLLQRLLGQINLPGIPSYAYEPDRLVKDGEGRAIEQARARPSYKAAEAKRARLNAQRAMMAADRKQEESQRYTIWALDQLQGGRRGDEITFDVFVRETGLWSPEPAPPFDSDFGGGVED